MGYQSLHVIDLFPRSTAIKELLSAGRRQTQTYKQTAGGLFGDDGSSSGGVEVTVRDYEVFVLEIVFSQIEIFKLKTVSERYNNPHLFTYLIILLLVGSTAATAAAAVASAVENLNRSVTDVSKAII